MTRAATAEVQRVFNEFDRYRRDVGRYALDGDDLEQAELEAFFEVVGPLLDPDAFSRKQPLQEGQDR